MKSKSFVFETNFDKLETPLLRIFEAMFDPVAIGSYLASIFGIDWKRIRYLVYSNSILGKAENFEVKKV